MLVSDVVLVSRAEFRQRMRTVTRASSEPITSDGGDDLCAWPTRTTPPHPRCGIVAQVGARAIEQRGPCGGERRQGAEDDRVTVVDGVAGGVSRDVAGEFAVHSGDVDVVRGLAPLRRGQAGAGK